MKKLSFILAVLLLFVIAFTSCSSKSTADKSSTESGAYYNGGRGEAVSSVAPSAPEMDMPKEDADASLGFATADVAASQDSIAPEMGAKIIKNGYMSVETLDFEDTIATIMRRVQQEGGFIASSNIQGWSNNQARHKPMRNAHFKIRIPSNRFEQFMTDVGELGNVTRSENWGEDVSAQYFDTEARLESLTIQEDRLLTILSKAEELTDIIELERELSSVRYQIENLTGTLRKWDNLVAFSTLDIDIYEVKVIEEIEEEPETLWEKIASGFKSSVKSVVEILEGLLIFLISAIPFLLLFSFIGVIIYGIVKLFLRKSGRRTYKAPIVENLQNKSDPSPSNEQSQNKE
jgi:hypothetical protein